MEEASIIATYLIIHKEAANDQLNDTETVYENLHAERINGTIKKQLPLCLRSRNIPRAAKETKESREHVQQWETVHRFKQNDPGSISNCLFC
tara:strand:- start:1203 stop:1478 length:276 start_codon:yes stop_codon:yes gene_type:complete